MKRALSQLLAFAGLATFCCLTQAQGNPPPAAPASAASTAAPAKVVLPPGITEEMLAPPPVPSFMLKKPETPLSVDEMVQQAREAERKAGIQPAPKPAQ